jgi:hypothetical protein
VGIELTLRWSRSGDLAAAYLGGCRVGYVQRRAPRFEAQGRGWMWWSDLTRPQGGCDSGVCASSDDAASRLTESVERWTTAAGLTTEKRDDVSS